jgi:hypothetical protein
MEALRTFVDTKHGCSSNMPPYGGWGDLEHFKKSGGEFDE